MLDHSSSLRSAPSRHDTLRRLLSRTRYGCLTLTLPDGSQVEAAGAEPGPCADLSLHRWRPMWRTLLQGDLGLAFSYRDGDWSSSNLTALLAFGLANEASLGQVTAARGPARWLARFLHRANANTRRGSRHNISAHYDLGNRFYGLWLDDTWTYSSACFDGDEQRSLADAQAAKYQRIVASLGLRAGMHVLEIGCGWGGFAMYAARQGIRVRALTISEAQYALAVERIARAGLSDRVTVELRDYRDIDGQYDAIVSIEMFEAVGEAFWPVYFDTLGQHLKAGARALIQSITIAEPQFEAYRASSDFIREFIFPGGMLPSAERFVDAAGRAGLAAEPVLAFGLDYARTLRAWREAFEDHVDAVRALGFDETFIRTWRLYLAYCEAGFAERRTDVMHFVVSSAR